MVHVYNDRAEYGNGVAIVTDRNGKEAYRFDVRAEGVNGRNRMRTGADTPLGTYDIPDGQAWISGGSRASYGPNARLNMTGESGEIAEFGRSAIRIHGGRQEKHNAETNTWTAVENPELKKTYGCLRAFDTDMATFQQTTNKLQANDSREIPGKVTVVNDLQKTLAPIGNNMVAVKAEYKVPKQENKIDLSGFYFNSISNSNSNSISISN